jgi:hypothetical protein
MSGEHLRQLVLAEGRTVLAAREAGEIPTAFAARDCLVAPVPSSTVLQGGQCGDGFGGVPAAAAAFRR